jgi:hypothetical protein
MGGRSARSQKGPSFVRRLILFALAALAFSSLAGVIQVLGERRSRRRLAEKTSTVFLPLTQHRFHSVR